MRTFAAAAKTGPMAKGTWRRFGVKSVLACCPGCGLVARLNHEIAADGTVSPSVECPGEGCGFHEAVKLEGWEERKSMKLKEGDVGNAGGATWEVVTAEEDELVIRDIGHNFGRSVTNAAEAVVEHLVKVGAAPRDGHVLYFDSEGALDALVIKGGKFSGFRSGTAEEVMRHVP